jgi:hypothetical protein
LLLLKRRKKQREVLKRNRPSAFVKEPGQAHAEYINNGPAS